ncbi:MAG: TRAP transporter substrate-binding protein DctP, partial [Deltaproteobacteria bacterium]|nr:TRAP transporter substrate-binding protein DctP [Deltaproteobacteria bacterium]
DNVSKIDIIGLTFFENGFRHVTNSVKPVMVPEDLKGLTIRTMQNKIHMASFETIGAKPKALPFGELYSSLKLKSFDAQENPIPIIYNSKFYEVQKYCSLTGHFYSPTPMFINKNLWNKLTDQQKEIFRLAAKEARDYQRTLIDQQSAQYVDKLKEKGMQVDEVDKAIWLQAMEPVYQKYENEVGLEVLKEVRAEIAKGSQDQAPLQ